MDLYGELLARVLFPVWEGGIRKRPTLRLLRHLERTARRPLVELEALQLGALRRLVAHAQRHVPFQRERFETARLRSEDLKSLADLHRLPVLDRLGFRAVGAERESEAPPFATIRKATSGTSGEPLAFGYDAGSEHFRQATKLRAYGWSGAGVGARTLHYWGEASASPRRLSRAKIALDRAFKRERYLSCNARGEEELARVVDVIRRDPPDAIVCYAQAGADLARFVVENRLRRWPDVAIVCGAERLLEADRAMMVEAFGPRVFETYGSREFMLMAAECEAHDGMHLSMENLLVEVVVREGEGEGEHTRAAAPGESGEVVVTDLHNFGMPFIRYANGDRATVGARDACRCGRTLIRLERVDGRVTETLTDAHGGHVSGLLFNTLVAHTGDTIQAFQVIQRADRSVTLRVVAKPTFDERALLSAATPHFRGLPVTIERVDEIPLDRSGKRRIVVIEKG